MMISYYAIFLLSFFLPSHHVYVQAWGTLGHEMVGNLAWHRLTKSTQVWVQQVLHIAKEKDGQSPLAQVADWADQIRHWQSWSAPLHFVDIRDDLIDGGCRNISEDCEFQYERDCPEDVCVAGAIVNFTNQLLLPPSNEESSVLRGGGSPLSLGTKKNLTQALMFLTHFVGDIHQPLHVSRKSDKGGNDYHVRFSLLAGHDEQRTNHHHHSWNLHSVWDTGIIEVVLERDYNNSRATMEEDLYNLSMTNRNNGTGCTLGMNATCVIGWAKESWDLALEYAYVVSDNVTQVTSGSILDELYYESRLPIVKQQLVLAGIRLAATLEAIASAATAAKEEEHRFISPSLWQAWKALKMKA